MFDHTLSNTSVEAYSNYQRNQISFSIKASEACRDLDSDGSNSL